MLAARQGEVDKVTIDLEVALRHSRTVSGFVSEARNSSDNSAMAVKVGDAAPDFEAIDSTGTAVRLADYRGRKLVLYFYPMDDTPGCTKQACSLRDFNTEIADKGAAILGVSAQSKASHQRFAEKYRLNFPLLVDTGQTVAKAYGAAGAGLFSVVRGLLGMNQRVTYIIDEAGYVSHVIDNPDTGVHGEEVLKHL